MKSASLVPATPTEERFVPEVFDGPNDALSASKLPPLVGFLKYLNHQQGKIIAANPNEKLCVRVVIDAYNISLCGLQH